MERCSIFSSWNGIRARFFDFLSPKSRRRFSKRSFWLLSRTGIHESPGSRTNRPEWVPDSEKFPDPARGPGPTGCCSWIPGQGLKELYIMSADVEDLTKNIIRYRDQERFIQSKFFRKIFKSFKITPWAPLQSTNRGRIGYLHQSLNRSWVRICGSGTKILVLGRNWYFATRYDA